MAILRIDFLLFPKNHGNFSFRAEVLSVGAMNSNMIGNCMECWNHGHLFVNALGFLNTTIWWQFLAHLPILSFRLLREGIDFLNTTSKALSHGVLDTFCAVLNYSARTRDRTLEWNWDFMKCTKALCKLLWTGIETCVSCLKFKVYIHFL